jgi:hypothetical protein
MALYGRVGNGPEVHKIGMALFEAGKSSGRSICGMEGEVSLAITATASCQECRNKSIEAEARHLASDRQVPVPGTLNKWGKKVRSSRRKEGTHGR